MAEFTNLDQVNEVLIAALLDLPAPPPDGRILSGPPLETIDANAEEIRLTLLWVTPQPGHRNDPWERTADGRSVPPRLTLSAFFMVSTYGSDDNKQPVRAHQLLGDVMRRFHDTPELHLPIPAAAGVGAGPLSIIQVPTAADLMEKVFSPLQLKHRPWVLFEVGPIQLVPETAVRAAAQPVAPGGVNVEMAAILRPSIGRILPHRQVAAGRVRVEADLMGRPLESVRVGRSTVPATAIEILGDGAITFDLPPTTPAGPMAVTIQAGGMHSEPAWIEVTLPGTLSVEALPVAVVATSGTLVLTGVRLATADAVAVWPDAGIAAAPEVRMLPVASATAGQVEVASAALIAAGFDNRLYRLAVRLPATAAAAVQFTPYIVARFA
jgi:uncharacterized protein DUF4255